VAGAGGRWVHGRPGAADLDGCGREETSMCRWLGYVGAPIEPRELLYDPSGR